MPSEMGFSSIHDPLVSATVISILPKPYDYRVWLDHADGKKNSRIKTFYSIYKTYPDAFIYSEGRQISVEIELSFKESGRILNRLEGYCSDGLLTDILYYFPEKSVMNNFLNRVKEFFNEEGMSDNESNRLRKRLKILCMSEEEYFDACIQNQISVDSFRPVEEIVLSKSVERGEHVSC